MPSSQRTFPVQVGARDAVLIADNQVHTGPEGDILSAAVAVLTNPDLAAVVDLVAWVRDGWLNVANVDGASRVALADPAGRWQVLHGHDPVAVQDPMHGVPLDVALDDPSPPNDRNSYPLAGVRLASVFADPHRSPDIVVVHSAAHHWPERGGHLGEHGSLDAGQSRAPLVLSGAGIGGRGMLDRSARIVDVAPTLALLAGASMAGPQGGPDVDAAAAAAAAAAVDLDGRPLADLCAPGARHVVGLLWDGANCNDLLNMAVTGELPAVARLLARGCALTGGAIAEFPSVTLTNHTSALTGVGPGRHGILNNVYFDRETGRRVIANDSSTWHVACDQLRDGVRTVFEVIAAARPGVSTACVNEPVDRGATYSTFALVRSMSGGDGASGLGEHLPSAQDDPHATAQWVAADPDYAWSTQVDALGLTQVAQLWGGDAQPPAFMWWNTTVTDTAHHSGGPYSPQARASMVDADRRLGVFLDLLDERGLTDDTAIVLTADHGSEGADPACTGDWDDALRAAGIPFRDEAYGFIYLGAHAAAETSPTGPV
nr:MULTISPECIES: alkaline phosphatase family protein [unclassified Frankia]